MQVSQIISSKIILDRLLQKIMHLSITNAGTQRGYLILNTDDKLTIEASENADKNDVAHAVKKNTRADDVTARYISKHRGKNCVSLLKKHGKSVLYRFQAHHAFKKIILLKTQNSAQINIELISPVFQVSGYIYKLCRSIISRCHQGQSAYFGEMIDSTQK